MSKESLELEVQNIIQSSVNNHQAFLEKQLRFLKWVFSIFVLLATSALYFFGVRSIDDLEKKIDRSIDQTKVELIVGQGIKNDINIMVKESINRAKEAIKDSTDTKIIPNALNIVESAFNMEVESKITSIVDKKVAELPDLQSKDLLIPSGAIVAWSKSEIPKGWILCNGKNGTPDLTNKFLLGTVNSRELRKTGGDLSHTHSYQLPVKPAEDPGFRGASTFVITTPQYSANSSIELKTLEAPNLPPYYKVFYIMKL